MGNFDDLSMEDGLMFDFVEEMNEDLFDEEDDNKSFNALLNSNIDF